MIAISPRPEYAFFRPRACGLLPEEGPEKGLDVVIQSLEHREPFCNTVLHLTFLCPTSIMVAAPENDSELNGLLPKGFLLVSTSRHVRGLFILLLTQKHSITCHCCQWSTPSLNAFISVLTVHYCFWSAYVLLLNENLPYLYIYFPICLFPHGPLCQECVPITHQGPTYSPIWV